MEGLIKNKDKAHFLFWQSQLYLKLPTINLYLIIREMTDAPTYRPVNIEVVDIA